MNEKDISEFDQAATDMLRTFPGMLFSYYKQLMEEGFTEHQAFDLTRDYQGALIVAGKPN